MKPYGWKPRANEYVGRGVEWLERVVSRRWARRQLRRELDEQVVAAQDPQPLRPRTGDGHDR